MTYCTSTVIVLVHSKSSSSTTVALSIAILATDINQLTVRTSYCSSNVFTVLPISTHLAMSIPSNHTHTVLSAGIEVTQCVVRFITNVILNHHAIHKHTEAIALCIRIIPFDLNWNITDFSRKAVHCQLLRRKGQEIMYTMSHKHLKSGPVLDYLTACVHMY